MTTRHMLHPIRWLRVPVALLVALSLFGCSQQPQSAGIGSQGLGAADKSEERVNGEEALPKLRGEGLDTLEKSAGSSTSEPAPPTGPEGLSTPPTSALAIADKGRIIDARPGSLFEFSWTNNGVEREKTASDNVLWPEPVEDDRRWKLVILFSGSPAPTSVDIRSWTGKLREKGIPVGSGRSVTCRASLQEDGCIIRRVQLDSARAWAIQIPRRLTSGAKWLVAQGTWNDPDEPVANTATYLYAVERGA